MIYNKHIQGKLYLYFTTRLNLKDSTKGFIRGDCPYCGGSNTFGINLNSNNVKCFKECFHDPNPLKVLMYLENFDTYAQAWSFLKLQQEYEYYEKPDKVTKEIQPMEFPESYQILSKGYSYLAKAARNYMRNRGFSVDALSRKGVGYCTSGDYMGYIIFPFFRQGRLIFFQGRKFTGFGPKMLNPSESIYGVGKEKIIYNGDALYIYNKVYLVESITNAETLGDRAIASLGKSVSQIQKSTILTSPIKELIIVLDPDAIGEALKLALDFCWYKKTRLVTWDGDKDVNDLGKSQTIKLIKNTPAGDYNHFRRMKNQLSL